MTSIEGSSPPSSRMPRASWAELGRAVGLSAPSVADRVARLERDGVITGYHAAVSPAAVGLGVSALVGVYENEGVDATVLVNALSAMEEIEDCWFVAGEEELVVRLRVWRCRCVGEGAVAAAAGDGGVPDPDDRGAVHPVGGAVPLPASDESDG